MKDDVSEMSDGELLDEWSKYERELVEAIERGEPWASKEYLDEMRADAAKFRNSIVAEQVAHEKSRP